MEVLVILIGVALSALLAQLVGAVSLGIRQYKYDRAIARLYRAIRKADEVTKRRSDDRKVVRS